MRRSALDRAALAAVMRRAGVRLAMLFGSAASGRMHPNSDIDIAFIPGRPGMSLREELELGAELERVAGRSVDLVDLDRASPLLRFEVARHGVELHARVQAEATEFRARAGIEWDEIGPLIEAGAERYRRGLAAAGDRGRP